MPATEVILTMLPLLSCNSGNASRQQKNDPFRLTPKISSQTSLVSAQIGVVNKARRAGVVDQHIQPAQFVSATRHHGPDFFFMGDIALAQDGRHPFLEPPASVSSASFCERE